MKEAKQTCYKMMVVIVLSGIVFAIPGAIISRQYIMFPVSVAAGCAVAVFLLFNLLKCAATIVEMPSKRAKTYGRWMSFLRKLLMVAALGVAYFYSDFINPWGVLLGLFSLKISAYLYRFVKIDFGSKGDETRNAGSVSTGS